MIGSDVRAALVAHAEAEAPNEACGLISLRDSVAERYLPGENLESSPYRFRLKPSSPEDLYLEDEGYQLALFHSHVEAPARPSKTDVELSHLWPRRPWVILSLRTGDMAAFRIEDGRIEELPLTTDA